MARLALYALTIHPLTDDAKLLPFAEAEAGASSVELLLPLALKWASDKQLTMSDAISKITEIPADILGINAGSLTIQSTADIVIFNPETAWKVAPNSLISQGKNTPFMGLTLQGRVNYTLLNGQITYQQA
jgi:dihydroorotase